MDAADEGGVMSLMSFKFDQSLDHMGRELVDTLRQFCSLEMFALRILLEVTAKHTVQRESF